jgi:pimeloyl-ACP methyl ester carboxylesterase
MGQIPLDAPTADAGVDGYGSGPHPRWLDIDWSRHLRWVTVEGRRVNVLDVGTGPAIVFVHGHNVCWQYWLDQVVAFMGTNRVIALDLPGFGHSDLPDGGVSITGYARAVDSVCEQLGVDSACMVGNSMGGFVVADLALEFPKRVERLVLVSAAGLATRYLGIPAAVIRHPIGVFKGRLAFGLGSAPPHVARAMASRPRGRVLAMAIFNARPVAHADRLHPALVYELIRAHARPGAAPAAVALASYEFRERLHEIAAPTLIVWGDRDNLVPLSCADEYVALIPGSRKVIYPDTGHNPMLERPARFNRDLAAFLADGA